MQAQADLALFNGIQHLASNSGKEVSVGTAFSGSDIVHMVVKSLSEYWADAFNIEVKFKKAFACESHPDRIKHIKRALQPDHIFVDAAELCCERVHDHMSGERKPIPWVDVFAAGFPCQSRSSANNSSRSNRGCVAKAEGETGRGCKAIMDYLASCKPTLILLEIVTPIAEVSDDGSGLSDADIVLPFLSGVLERSVLRTQ